MDSQVVDAARVIALVPCFNEAHRLDKYIKTVREQTVRTEIIAVDDGSSDETWSVLKRHNLLHIEKNEQNLGLSKTFNKLFSIAKTYSPDYLTWSGVDDYPYFDGIERRLELLNATGKDIVVSGFDVATPQGLIRFPETLPSHVHLPLVNFDTLHTELLSGNFIGPPILLNMRNIDYEDLPWDTRLKHLPDWEQWLRLSKKYSFGFLNSSTCVSDWDGNNFSTSRPSLYSEKLNEMIYILGRYLFPQQRPLEPLMVATTLIKIVERLTKYLRETHQSYP